ncbi:MAG TPA: metallophosphoesterase family protein [Actinomycetota bacterium]|nr:metallophosphoesterase family protein [Actinomycetota bacterium]
MRIAVISDIHSNLEALEAVLARANDEHTETTYVLGDIVGYGADPDAVVARLAEQPSAVCIAGNHDLAATGRFDTDWFNAIATDAIHWTVSVMSDETRTFLAGLEPRADAAEGLLVHGSVVDPAAEYVMNVEAARASFDAGAFPRCFFGHTHLPTLFVNEGGRIDGVALRDGEPVSLAGDGSKRFMINPGSVGQPRDGDARASLMIVDTEAMSAVVHRVTYAIDDAAGKIREAGLPIALAERLAYGR